MIKLFWMAAVFAGRPADDDPQRPWQRDPLLHPQLRDMSQRQLADLPFPQPGRDDRPASGCCA